MTSHQWWVLGGVHRTTVRAQKILDDLDDTNTAKIMISMDPSALSFAKNSRVTKWRNGQFAIIANNMFLVQDGTEAMRAEVKSREWSYRIAIECQATTRGCKVSSHTHGRSSPNDGTLVKLAVRHEIG